jgi:Nif-specific regulatory protein
MIQYDWPGNIRELRNAIERAVIVGSSSHIEVEDFPETVRKPATSMSLKQALVDARRNIVLDAFRVANGKHATAAELLKIHPNNLHRMLKELDIRDQARQTSGVFHE